MTVVSALITKHCTAHASDSLITTLQLDGKREPLEWEQSKIVPVRRLRGAMTYWGLAKYDAYQWSTFDWLNNQVGVLADHTTAEGFALALTQALRNTVSQMVFFRQTDAGIGIHFSAYEYVNGYWIPELFLISNWAGPGYSSLRSDGIGLSRETYHTISGYPPQPEHREDKYRLAVHDYLFKGGLIFYNNGDPVMFNSAANAIFSGMRILAERQQLAPIDTPEKHIAIVRRPVEMVSAIQRDFCRIGDRVVGGRPHDLVVTPMGGFSSTSSDAAGV